ncbi:hypothetical protein [Alloprevotella tannerae]|uniref:hypothetical protein n=1 Tax=Alloprevotella tannerae TaxID=76122 RepID=UPI00288AA826|nr:hypothetical protein [Alloprevotella tannerae]
MIFVLRNGLAVLTFLGRARLLRFVCREQTIVWRQQTIVWSEQTIVWREQTKKFPNLAHKNSRLGALKMEKMKGGTQRKDAMWLPSSYRADPWRRVDDLPRLGLG